MSPATISITCGTAVIKLSVPGQLEFAVQEYASSFANNGDRLNVIELYARFLIHCKNSDNEAALFVLKSMCQMFDIPNVNIHEVVQQQYLDREAVSCAKGVLLIVEQCTKSLQSALLSSNFLLAVFGGQPSSADYIDEAKRLLNIMSNFLETQSQDKNFSQVYGCGFDVFSWLVRPRSMPDYDYIALVPVKMPVTGLIQLMQVMVLFKTLNVSPGKLLRFFEAATEHSQEMVTAVAFSMMSDEQSFYRIGFKVLGILMLTSATPCINMWKQNALDEAYDSDDSGVEVANTPASRAQIRDIENAYLHQKKELQDTWGNKFWKQDAEISPLRGSLAV
ncbi:hypothetical protein BX667DRAFT_505236 [Coemansia mojavensis]|nr:hypothetical protein BX667DRAFT_505236 [Coemansia mojavensis]